MAVISISSSLPLSANRTICRIEKCRTMEELRQIHGQMIKTGLIFHSSTVNKFIHVCGLSNISGSLDYASHLFERIQEPSRYAFFSLIRGFSDSPNPLMSIVFFAKFLQCSGNLNDFEFSLPSVLKACGKTSSFDEGQQICGQILKTQLLNDMFVSNSVIRMFVDFGKIEVARILFDKLPKRDVFSWNSMLSGYFKMGMLDSARQLFDEMPDKNLISSNIMIDGYMKSGKCELARLIFDEMKQRDVISWTCMISGYGLNHRPMEALELFRKMLRTEILPDVPAIVNVLSSISDLGFIEEGKWIHSYISKRKIKLISGSLASALIDMYSKCGYIEDALNVFREISIEGRIGDWNSILSGLAIHGLGEEAVGVFGEMNDMGIEPDEITFLSLLSACSHGGLVKEGQLYFHLMTNKYKVIPKIQHYGCLIDLLGRSGYVNKALSVIQEMPVEADVQAWKSILGACTKHGNIVIGEYVAKKILALSPNDSSSYVLLSNLYAKYNQWDEVSKIRSTMKERGVRKVPGCSKVVINDIIHEFLAGTPMDMKYKEVVRKKVNEIIYRLKMEGYKPDTSQVLLEVEEEEGKEECLSLHGEKLAIAFALLQLNNGEPIHVIKNLRVCCDCHSFCKLVSKVYKHEIILRDQNRFHHFKEGSCSCRDYW